MYLTCISTVINVQVEGKKREEKNETRRIERSIKYTV